MGLFLKVSGPGLHGELREHESCQWLHEQLPQFADIVGAAQVLKRDPAHSVLVIASLIGEGSALLCKFFPTQGFGDSLRQCCRLDRPARIHRRLKNLPDTGLRIPPSLGHIAIRGLGSAWFCPLVAGKSLLHWADDRLPGAEEAQLQLLKPVIDAMLDLHRAGFVHGDFKWGNVLFDTKSGHYWLVDVDGVRATGAGFGRGKVRDLARFLLDCSEAGVDDAPVRQLRDRYAEGSGLDRQVVAALTQPVMDLLRQRHIRRYGNGYRLTLPDSDT